MKYFIDTEFLEGKQDKRLFGIKYGETKPTIDLISVALVAEDGREYYAISKDFNLEEAWNRYDLKEIVCPIEGTPSGEFKKVYWIRENVLDPIHTYLCSKCSTYEKTYFYNLFGPFTMRSMKNLLNWYGKTNEKIAEEVYQFVNPLLAYHISSYNNSELKPGGALDGHFEAHNVTEFFGHFVAQPEFYGYYADYDWVVFCWLFGGMIDLPSGFPMYCRDLKQELDKYKSDSLLMQKEGWSGVLEKLQDDGDVYKVKVVKESEIDSNPKVGATFFIEKKYLKPIGDIKAHPSYPKQTNEHDALSDARWNKQLYDFLQTL